MRRHYIFYGSVQGVGFRWRAYHAAAMNRVTGFARNLPDGSVEMEAEGTREAIDNTVRAIAQGQFVMIEHMDAREIPEKGDRSFEIG